MNKGRATCDKLKDIRKAIAEANGIEYNSEECTFEGDCSGTCPKCDAELKLLTKLTAEKEAKGEEVVIPTTLIEEILGMESDDEEMDWHTAGIPALPKEEDYDPSPGMRGTDVAWREIDEWKARHPEYKEDHEDLDGDIMPLRGDICAPDDEDDEAEILEGMPRPMPSKEMVDAFKALLRGALFEQVDATGKRYITEQQADEIMSLDDEDFAYAIFNDKDAEELAKRWALRFREFTSDEIYYFQEEFVAYLKDYLHENNQYDAEHFQKYLAICTAERAKAYLQVGSSAKDLLYFILQQEKEDGNLDAFIDMKQ